MRIAHGQVILFKVGWTGTTGGIGKRSLCTFVPGDPGCFLSVAADVLSKPAIPVHDKSLPGLLTKPSLDKLFLHTHPCVEAALIKILDSPFIG